MFVIVFFKKIYETCKWYCIKLKKKIKTYVEGEGINGEVCMKTYKCYCMNLRESNKKIFRIFQMPEIRSKY